jgi:hypothetical protein
MTAVLCAKLWQVYYAFQAMRNENFSIASIVKLQQSSELLLRSIYTLKYWFETTCRLWGVIKALYEFENINNKIQDGLAPYLTLSGPSTQECHLSSGMCDSKL